MNKFIAAALGMVLSASASATVVNGDFETGDLSGWTASSGAFVTTSAIAGAFSAELNSGGSLSVSAMEAFFGLTAGSLTAADLTDPTPEYAGEAIKQTVSVSAGDVLSFDWTVEFLEGNTTYNDAAFFATVDSGDVIIELADGISSPGIVSGTGTYTFLTSGLHTIGFARINGGDGCCGGPLYVDNVSFTGVPAPLTGTLLLGGLALLASRKLKGK